MTDTPRFDVTGPLPVGRTTLLEASAGTGKTYALAALATRFVAEQDVPIGRVLLVTFTRAATAELRDRIRRRLVEAAAHLSAPEPTSDPLLNHLADVADGERMQRQQRLARAVREFDTATITTIHGFCSQVRASRGVLTDENVDAVPTESESLLIQQVSTDLIYAAATAAGTEPADLPSVSELVALVSKIRTLGQCELAAESGQARDVRLMELAAEAVEQVDDRLRRAGELSFDSLLTSVRDALRDTPELVGDLRRQYDVALIDEFQDTDPVQWEIFRTVFHDVGGGSTLVLVGDPKQAIYAFRGGDVYTYLAARSDADVMALGTNQRSDAAAVGAMNALGRTQSFGEPDIAYQVVESSERHAGRRLVRSNAAGDWITAPGLAVRCVVDAAACEPGLDKLRTDPARRRIAADVADVAADLLTSSRIENAGLDATPMDPSKIAVLVGSSYEAGPIADALRVRGIPAVLRLGDSVGASPAADQWRTLLFALDRPAATPRAAAAALTWFFGWSPQRVAAAVTVDGSEDESAEVTALVELQHVLVGWADMLRRQGVPALVGAARRTTDMVPRLLSGEQGERDLTDLEHIAELLHVEAHNRGGGVTAAQALGLLDELGAQATDEMAADAVQRRVESEADAVQIMTIHGAKGLEFPVVLLPGLWAGGKRVQASGDYSYFDRASSRRILDVSTKQPANGDDKEVPRPKMAPNAAAETTRQNCGDQHRMTYVALTRALHQTIVWWAPCGQGGNLTGLARMLFDAPADHPASEKVTMPPASGQLEHLRSRFADVAEVAVDEVVARSANLPPVQLAPPVASGEVRTATLDRELARSGSRWSFSGIKKVIRTSQGRITSAGIEGDPTVEFSDDSGANDEPDVAPLAGSDAEAPPGASSGLWAQPSPFDGLGAGPDFGNLVHDLFEHVDFADQDLEQAFAIALASVTRYRVTDEQRSRLPQVLADVVRTPLGAQFGGVQLADLTAARRLNELGFFVPLAPTQPIAGVEVGRLVRSHLSEDDPLHEWAHRLAAGLAHIDLQGYLNGSIDLIFRFDIEGVTKYSVVDYKTNLLSSPGSPGSLADYHPSRLPSAMVHHHYALQSLVYSVALHRYLRWRLEGYEPSLHLGPIGYLFVRGMIGPDTPVASEAPHAGIPAGVYTWQPPTGLIEDLSDLLAGAGAAATGEGVAS